VWPVGRRSLAATVAASLAAASLAGCGTAKHPFHPLQAAICGYTAYRAVHDLRNGHRFAGAFNAYLAAHHCPKVTK
jgi:hypothetical protein